MSEERIERIENVLREFIQSRVEKAERIISHLTDSDCITDIRTANEVDKALLVKLKSSCEKKEPRHSYHIASEYETIEISKEVHDALKWGWIGKREIADKLEHLIRDSIDICNEIVEGELITIKGVYIRKLIAELRGEQK